MEDSGSNIGRADDLFFLSHILALGSHLWYEKFPNLDDMVDDDRLLVYLATITGVAVGVSLVDDGADEDEFERFAVSIADKLRDWNYLDYQPFGEGGAYRAYADLANFVKDKKGDIYFPSVGFWLASNLKGRRPNNDEVLTGTSIAMLFGVSLDGWWDQKQGC